MAAGPSTQFTPVQILEAARRAESDGRRDYAQQFYGHLVDHYASLPEGQAARQALERLLPAQAGVDPREGPRFSSPYQPDISAGGPHSLVEPGFGPPQSVLADTHAHAPGSASHMRNWQPYQREAAAHRHHESNERFATRAPDHPRMQLPDPVSDYGLARLLARAMTWLGFPTLTCGLVLIVASGALPDSMFRGIVELPFETVFGLGAIAFLFGAGLVVGGLTMLAAGQTLRALLEQALATRDMSMIMRWDAEMRADQMDARRGPPRRHRT